jgi:hypothetical protein
MRRRVRARRRISARATPRIRDARTRAHCTAGGHVTRNRPLSAMTHCASTTRYRIDVDVSVTRP